jgi:hypothetical protein
MTTLEARFMARVDASGDCWLWTGGRAGYMKYGALRVDGRMTYAHRVAYELFVGPIPEGLQLDHLCSVPHCVNPEHLEPVTARENVLRSRGLTAQNARKTHCKYGHPFDERNTHRFRGRRYCRTCRGTPLLDSPEEDPQRNAEDSLSPAFGLAANSPSSSGVQLSLTEQAA